MKREPGKKEGNGKKRGKKKKGKKKKKRLFSVKLFQRSDPTAFYPRQCFSPFSHGIGLENSFLNSFQIILVPFFFLSLCKENGMKEKKEGGLGCRKLVNN